LIVEQFPQWRHEPIRYLETGGTVNAIYRVGADFTVRFPLRADNPSGCAADLVQEASAMRELAARCPFRTPTRVAQGAPGVRYPLP
jgi:aminoglycoside phosphotransferase (APT) family kinase protein